MSVVDLNTVSSENLKQRVTSLILFEDWADEFGACGHPSLLHEEFRPCTRAEHEPPAN